MSVFCFFFQAEDGIRDLVRSRGLGDVYKRQVRNVPKWNPINVCSYHLQEAGATPVQEVAYTLANAVAVLDAVKASGQVAEEELPKVVGRISFFCNAGIRFVEEMCKAVSYTHLRAHETVLDLVCRLLLEKKKITNNINSTSHIILTI